MKGPEEGLTFGLTGLPSSGEAALAGGLGERTCDPPQQPEVVIPTHLQTVEASVDTAWRAIVEEQASHRVSSADAAPTVRPA